MIDIVKPIASYVFATVVSVLLESQVFAQEDKTLYVRDSLMINTHSATFGQQELYNAYRQLEQLRLQEETPECRVNYTYYFNPLSLVGHFYSYESGESGIRACGVPGSTLAVQTVDLATQHPVRLTDLFTERSVVEALRQDSWVIMRAQEAGQGLDSLMTYDAILKMINRLPYGVTFFPHSFAIASYNNTTGLAAVRLVGRQYMGFNHHQHLQLGLWLAPTRLFAKQIKDNTYFLLGDYKNGLP